MAADAGLVKWLATKNPQAKWDYFLSPDGTSLRWDRVIICGASHGATSAARFAKAVRVEMKDSGLTAKELWKNEDYSLLYNSPVLKDGLLYCISARDRLYCINTKDGKTACIMNGPWSIADYQSKGIDAQLTTIPTVSSSGNPGKPFVGVKMLMLANKAKEPQAAVDLMKYYGSPEVQALVAQHRAGINVFYDCTDEIYAGLAEMYVSDPRFKANYDSERPGLAEFLREAMLISLGKQGA